MWMALTSYSTYERFDVCVAQKEQNHVGSQEPDPAREVLEMRCTIHRSPLPFYVSTSVRTRTKLVKTGGGII